MNALADGALSLWAYTADSAKNTGRQRAAMIAAFIVGIVVLRRMPSRSLPSDGTPEAGPALAEFSVPMPEQNHQPGH